MADPFDVPLPAIGAKPWTLNPAVEEVRDRIGSVDDIIETGRLSPDGLEAELIAVASDLNPEALSDEFIAQQVVTEGTETNTEVYSAINTSVDTAISDYRGKQSVNVRDYKLPGDPDDSASFQRAHDALGSKGGAIIVPQTATGYILGTPLYITKKWVRVLGQGAEIRGTIFVGDATTPEQMNGLITGLNWIFTGVAPGRNGIVFRNTRQFEVTGCQFTNCDNAILMDAGTGAGFHSISSINIHHNQFFTCNYHVKAIDGNSFANAAISDCVIDTNIMNIALYRNIDIQQIDGIHISGNTTFMIGYTKYGTDPNILLKEQCIYIGSSNFVQIHGNNLFEAGYEGILLENARGANISGNAIPRPGQRNLRSGIKVTGLTNSTIEISNNRVELYTRDAVELLGTTASPAILIGNVGRYDAGTPTYWGLSEGAPAITTVSHAVVAVDSAFTGPVPITGVGQSTSTGENIRLSQLNAGIRSHSRLGPWSVFSDRVVTTGTFTAGGTTNLGLLRDATNVAQNYGGLIFVTAKRTSDSAAKTSTYWLHIQGNSVTTLSAKGLTAGAAADDPSFTWGTSSNTLQATAVGSTSGSFTFDYTVLGNLLIV